MPIFSGGASMIGWCKEGEYKEIKVKMIIYKKKILKFF